MPNPRGNPQNLLPGGKPGNRGGGNIKSKVRELCRQGFEEALPTIIEIAKGNATREFMGNEVDPQFSERVRAADVLAKYGLGEAKAIVAEDVLIAVGEVAADYVPPERLEAFTAALTERLKDCE